MWILGDYRSAREHFLRARDLDTLRFRADSKINDINRSVALVLGAKLVDVDENFAKESPNGIVGSELVYEHVHLTPEGNYLLARAMFRQIADSCQRRRDKPRLSRTAALLPMFFLKLNASSCWRSPVPPGQGAAETHGHSRDGVRNRPARGEAAEVETGP